MKPQRDQTTWIRKGLSEVARRGHADPAKLGLDFRLQERGERIGKRSRERLVDALEHPEVGIGGLLMAQIERPQSLAVRETTATA